jgi:large exoprotein involved in heme utilization and adhesion
VKVTADSFVFDNNFEFSASKAEAPPQLTVNIPIGLRFRDNPGSITVQGPGNNLQFNPEFLEFSRNSTPQGLVDPSQALVELPNNLPDPRDQIAQNPCQRGIGSEFIVIGRGGFPSSPNETLTGNNIQVDLVKPAISGENSQSANINQPKTFPIARRDIIPAQGWIFNKKGEVVLTAYDPTGNIPQRNSPTTVACPAHL